MFGVRLLDSCYSLVALFKQPDEAAFAMFERLQLKSRLLMKD